MRRWVLLMLAAALSACAEREPSSPTVLGLFPGQGTPDVTSSIQIDGIGFYPWVRTSFGESAQSEVNNRFQCQLVAPGVAASPVALINVQRISASMLTATVPAGLAQATYDFTMTDPQGRTAKLSQAYRVVTPAVDVAQLIIAPIGPQHAGVPFVVSATAADATSHIVSGYTETVAAQDQTLSLGPASLGPFTFGSLTSLVAVTNVSSTDTLTLRDTFGHQGVSNTFTVDPGIPAQIAVTGATQAVAGLCSALVLTVEDAFGNASPLSASLSLSFSATQSDGFIWSLDPACGSTISSATITTGESTLQIYDEATTAGAATAHVVPTALPEVLIPLTISPAPPTALAITTSAQTLPVTAPCSSLVDVETIDSFGNPSAPSSSSTLSLASSPVGMLTFFSDSGCTSSIDTVMLTPSGSAGFYFRGTTPQTVELDVSGSGLAAAAQAEAVTP